MAVSEGNGASTADHDPLSGLEEVGWDRLHHAYGRAVDVPGQLRALRSPDEQIRARALGKLYGNVYHQGTRWQASCHAVPFLVALVADPETPERAAVIALLRAVGIGDLRDDDLPLNIDRHFGVAAAATDDDVELVVAALYDDNRDLDELPDGVDVAVDARWRRDAYLAAAGHLDTYRALLADLDAEVASRAAELLAWFPSEQTTVTALVNVPADRWHADVRASANLTLAWHIGTDIGTDIGIDARLRDQLSSEVPVVRRTAAIALAFRLGRALTEVAVEVLTEPAGADSASAVPGWDRPLTALIALARGRADGSLP